MELYQLRTFAMVADEGNLTRAARRLNTSQPAISAQIKALEDEFGVALFLRTPKGMVLTAEGTRLRERASQILSSVTAMEQEAHTMRGVLCGELRIGINATPDILRIAELFAGMRSAHPELHLHLLQAMTGEVAAKLETGELDAGFMFGAVRSDRLHILELEQLEMVIAGAPATQEQLDGARPADLADAPWIMTPDDCPFHAVAAGFFQRHGITPQQAALIDDESIIRSMVHHGAGLAFLLRIDAMGRNGETPLAIWDEEAMHLPLSCCCLKRKKSEPGLAALFTHLAAIWKPTGRTTICMENSGHGRPLSS